jgi:hypothetical protein
MVPFYLYCSGEMVDAVDLKSTGEISMCVRVTPTVTIFFKIIILKKINLFLNKYLT